MANADKLSDDAQLPFPVEVYDRSTWSPIRPAFEAEVLASKASIQAFAEKWRAKISRLNAGNTALILLWLNIELAVWQAMRLIGGPGIPPEPFRERKAILQSLDAVIDWCASGNDTDLPKSALAAVVDGGLASVLQMASSCPATLRCTEMMRTMLAADTTRYSWSLNDWTCQLSMSKKTIQRCDAWREVMAWRESQKRELVSKETAKKNSR